MDNKKTKNAVFAFSAAAALLASLRYAPEFRNTVPVSACVLLLFLLCRDRTGEWDGKSPMKTALAAAAVLTMLPFLYRIYSSVPLGRWKWPVLAAAGVIVAVFYIMAYLRLGTLFSPVERETLPERDALSRTEWIAVALSAVAVITVCSKSSPLYPMNDWVDAHCFFTVGKSMLSGKVLYRDVYEQKGFWLYAFHALASLVSRRTFLGVWLLEIVEAFFFLLFSYKTIRLLTGKNTAAVVPLMAAFVYTLPSFCHGDSAEEMCLPMLAFALYLSTSSALRRQPLRFREWLWIGITSGLVFWIKYSLVGFYVGWALVPLFAALRRRDYRSVGRMVGGVAAGVAAVTAPVILYFAFHGAMRDLWTVYFYNNIFLYNNSGSLLSMLRNSVGSSFHFSAALYALMLFSMPYALKKCPAGLCVQTALALGALCAAIFRTKIAYNYYSFILAAFSVFFFAMAAELGQRFLSWRPAGKTVLSAGLAALIVVMTCENLYLLRVPREEMPQYRFDRIISQQEDPSLLNYDFLDGGFYTVSGIVPTCRFFCGLNITLPELREEQEACIREGKVDFIVTRNRKLDSPLYRCVDRSEMYFEGFVWYYSLYARNDVLPQLPEAP